MATVRTQKEIRQRAPIWLLTLLFVNLVVMAVDARDDESQHRVIRMWAQAVVAPLQSATSRVGGASAGLVRQIVNFSSTAKENERLQERVASLEVELRTTREHSVENERLRGLLGLKDQTGFKNVPARVIARDASVWFNTVTINRGSSSGITLNMPVVTASGIVGRVIATSPWTAQVMLITDEKSAAGAVVGQLQDSGALGSIRGLGNTGLIEMRYVSGLHKVEVGDYVLTTGQDGIYPPGLNIGEVVEVSNGSATMPHEIKIKPGARLDQLEEVAVLLYSPPERPAPEQTLPNVDRPRK
jgi:rod shape-determining protein MreC